MPTWVKVAFDAWTTAAAIADGPVFRSVNRGGQIRDTGLSEKVVWQLIRPYAEAAGVAGIAPHDCRRYAECRIMPNRRRRSPFGARFRYCPMRVIRHNRPDARGF